MDPTLSAKAISVDTLTCRIRNGLLMHDGYKRIQDPSVTPGWLKGTCSRDDIPVDLRRGPAAVQRRNTNGCAYGWHSSICLELPRSSRCSPQPQSQIMFKNFRGIENRRHPPDLMYYSSSTVSWCGFYEIVDTSSTIHEISLEDIKDAAWWISMIPTSRRAHQTYLEPMATSGIDSNEQVATSSRGSWSSSRLEN
jgi:hypothetical protein